MAFLLSQGKYDDSPFAYGLFGFTLAVLTFAYVYSVKVRTENIALRGLSREFFEINQIYQSTMQQTFLVENPVTDQEALIKTEKEMLEAVCQRISNIFEMVIGRKCMVTIKLITYEKNKCYAHTYVRNLKASVRDMPERIKYVVGDEQNTGFEAALKHRNDGRQPHFHSSDLEREPGYQNQRSDFKRHYRNVLVVPIREPAFEKERRQDTQGMQNDQTLIGFLCVDTLSVNRINNGFHLVMLSALASQMYTFMCFMRGRYKVLVGDR